MRFFKRLMEIKEEQLKNELNARIARYHTVNILTEILEIMKGGKDGKNKNKRNR
jgi:hypothetical protein